MGISLQDQLLKAGVVDKQKAQEVNSSKRKKQNRRNKGMAAANEQEVLRKAQAEKVARDKELNREKKQQLQRNEIAAQIKQLIEVNRLPLEQGDIQYNFTDGKKIRHIYVPKDVFLQLGRASLVVVRYQQGYAVVPVGVAEKIKERDKTVVMENSNAVAGDADDDMYADYQVPDDLIW